MDSKTNINELKEKVKKFCEDRDWERFHNPKDLAIGVVTEASELLDHFRFKSDEQMREMLNDPKKRVEIGEEIADIFYFLLRFAQMNNIDLATELDRKLEINNKKYPIEKTKEKLFKKYTEY
ncbi:MAG: nucleotide pyrophosphohydrolase [Candidatus Woesearchaeota archaeon]